MTGPGCRPRDAALRGMGGERNAVRAAQLRALGHGERSIARQLRLERDAVARWFALQDDLAAGADLDGVA